MYAEAVARRFPLVSRVKPPGRSLDERIAALGQTLREPAGADTYDRLARASEALNVAALIASDCGMPEVATRLCWEHYAIFDTARPLPFKVAKLALQPVLNIPRQMIREGDGAAAYAVLAALLDAARHKTAAMVEGHRVDMADVTLLPEDHKTICTGLWAAVLTDGSRALVQAGRWTEAAEALALQRGVGIRLLDGRQVSILALVQQNNARLAVVMADESQLVDPWEKVVGAILRTYCRAAAGALTENDLGDALAAALGLVDETEPTTVVFRVRVALAAVDLAAVLGRPRQEATGAQLIHAITARAAHDAYAAREVLASDVLRDAMKSADKELLCGVVKASGLGTGIMPAPLSTDFETTVQEARERLSRLLMDSAIILSRDRG
jgi:hypothetical protein